MKLNAMNSRRDPSGAIKLLHCILWSLSSSLILGWGINTMAQDLNKCATYANITKEIAELRQRGLSRSEIKQNLTEIMKLKNNSKDTLNEWMQSLEWLYEREHVRLSPQMAQALRLDECKRELGIIDWK